MDSSRRRVVVVYKEEMPSGTELCGLARWVANKGFNMKRGVNIFVRK